MIAITASNVGEHRDQELLTKLASAKLTVPHLSSLYVTAETGNVSGSNSMIHSVIHYVQDSVQKMIAISKHIVFGMQRIVFLHVLHRLEKVHANRKTIVCGTFQMLVVTQRVFRMNVLKLLNHQHVMSQHTASGIQLIVSPHVLRLMNKHVTPKRIVLGTLQMMVQKSAFQVLVLKLLHNLHVPTQRTASGINSVLQKQPIQPSFRHFRL